METKPAHVVVIGGGITGLAAAVWLRDHAFQYRAGLRITIVDGASQLGGKLYTGQLAGAACELGAESFLLRVPHAVRFASRLGLFEEIIHPTQARPSIWHDRRLWPLPEKTLMGIPSQLDTLPSQLFTAAEVGKIQAEVDMPGEDLESDVAIGPLARLRLGSAVVERLIDPLLGGVYASDSDQLSLAATMPALYASLQHQPSWIRAAQQVLNTKPSNIDQPIFGTIRGGLTRLVDAAAHVSGAEIHLGQSVRNLTPTATGWQLVMDATGQPTILNADAVILSTPAHSATQLLSAVAPLAAAELNTIEYASVALVSYALPLTQLPQVSGVLIPKNSGGLIKAITFTSNKWALDNGVCLLRASVGRFGQEQALTLDDRDLIEVVTAELKTITGPLPAPLEASVTRWLDALPQYRPGHLQRLQRARRMLVEHPTLALAGAAYDGVGIAACIRSGEQAAATILNAIGGPTSA